MKKQHLPILLSSPILALICRAYILWGDETPLEILLLPMMFFRTVIIPIITFVLLNRFLKKASVTAKEKLILSCATFAVVTATVITFCLHDGIPYYSSPYFTAIVPSRVAWAVICGVLILGNSAMARRYSRKAIFSAFLAGEGIFAALFVAFFTYFASDIVNEEFIELLLLPFSSVVGIIYSYYLGANLYNNRVLRLTAWFVELLGAKFVAYSILGTPHSAPTEGIGLILWLGSTAMIFVFALLGLLRSKVKKV